MAAWETLLAVCVAVCLAHSVSTMEPDFPTIKLTSSSLKFSLEKLQEFFQCLCRRDLDDCKISYDENNATVTGVSNSSLSQPDSSKAPGNTFVCDPPTRATFSCVRKPQNYDPTCGCASDCIRWFINRTHHPSCECVNIIWNDCDVEYDNFDEREPVEGSCPIDEPATTTTATTEEPTTTVMAEDTGVAVPTVKATSLGGGATDVAVASTDQLNLNTSVPNMTNPTHLAETSRGGESDNKKLLLGLGIGGSIALVLIAALIIDFALRRRRRRIVKKLKGLTVHRLRPPSDHYCLPFDDDTHAPPPTYESQVRNGPKPMRPPDGIYAESLQGTDNDYGYSSCDNTLDDDTPEKRRRMPESNYESVDDVMTNNPCEARSEKKQHLYPKIKLGVTMYEEITPESISEPMRGPLPGVDKERIVALRKTEMRDCDGGGVGDREGDKKEKETVEGKVYAKLHERKVKDEDLSTYNINSGVDADLKPRCMYARLKSGSNGKDHDDVEESSLATYGISSASCEFPANAGNENKIGEAKEDKYEGEIGKNGVGTQKNAERAAGDENSTPYAELHAGGLRKNKNLNEIISETYNQSYQSPQYKKSITVEDYNNGSGYNNVTGGGVNAGGSDVSPGQYHSKFRVAEGQQQTGEYFELETENLGEVMKDKDGTTDREKERESKL